MNLPQFATTFITKCGRKAPPTHKPEWAFFMAGWMFALPPVTVWMVPKWLMGLPVVGDFLMTQGWWMWARWIIPGLFSFFMMRTGVRYICRGIQLCFPDELQAFESEREMGL